MGRSCIVDKCTSAFNKNISIHRFPSDIALRDIWMQQIKNHTTKNIDKKGMYVCAQHFEKQLLIKTNLRINLAANAIPTIFKRIDNLSDAQTRSQNTLDNPSSDDSQIIELDEEEEYLEDIENTDNFIPNDAQSLPQKALDNPSSDDIQVIELDEEYLEDTENADNFIPSIKSPKMDENIENNDIDEIEMTLNMDCWSDELTPAQNSTYEQVEKIHWELINKLRETVMVNGGENLNSIDVLQSFPKFTAGLLPSRNLGNGIIVSKPIAKANPVVTEQKQKSIQQTAVVKQHESNQKKRTADFCHNNNNNYQDQDANVDNNDDDVNINYIPVNKRANISSLSDTTSDNRIRIQQPQERNSLGSAAKSTVINVSKPVKNNITSVIVQPSENSSIGGLIVDDPNRKKKLNVDLTKDGGDGGDGHGDGTGNKILYDCREITFNKLQGTTFPSLVVFARPGLNIKENSYDRRSFDSMIKMVLTLTATKYTEWLIQKGLVRSTQMCLIHQHNVLKLGMYSEETKFPYSGGYVWISECCPSRFVSVFNGSLFECAPYPPSVLLKLIYHWSCQTNAKSVVQWVNINNGYLKGIYTMLRSVCIVAIHKHMRLLGGLGKTVEVGIIALGTTVRGEPHRRKVEILGVFEPDTKMVRLRVVEPLANTDGEPLNRKRVRKMLEPITDMVRKNSKIFTDLSIDKGTLHAMGYNFVSQNKTTNSKQNSNANIMNYLRSIVPRMFQNTLSLLSPQIIQQFLDELAWRERFGTTAESAFNHIVVHISDQTRLNTKETFISRLNKVALNPFQNWDHLSKSSESSTLDSHGKNVTGKTAATNVLAFKSYNRKLKSPPPPPPIRPKHPINHYSNKRLTNIGGYDLNKNQQQQQQQQQVNAKNETKTSTGEIQINLESYYYGVLKNNDSAVILKDSGKIVENFKVYCPECHLEFTNNIDLLLHLLTIHINPINDDEESSSVQCHFCLENHSDAYALATHKLLMHTLDTKRPLNYYECLICTIRFGQAQLLGEHMHKMHVATELPYNCGCCEFASSSHFHTIEHFHMKHCSTGALQCPMCLKIYTVFSKYSEEIPENTLAFYEHLKLHQQQQEQQENGQTTNRKCSRCILKFTNEGDFKTHTIFAHQSKKSFHREITPLCKCATRIPKPKNQKPTNKEIDYVNKEFNYVLDVENGKMCLECDTDFDEINHIGGLIKCTKCKYQTACIRAYYQHTESCSKDSLTTTIPLDIEMHCICGFTSWEGNELAQHLVICQRKSAYSSVEDVQENCVKWNVMDLSEEGKDTADIDTESKNYEVKHIEDKDIEDKGTEDKDTEDKDFDDSYDHFDGIDDDHENYVSDNENDQNISELDDFPQEQKQLNNKVIGSTFADQFSAFISGKVNTLDDFGGPTSIASSSPSSPQNDLDFL